MKTLRLLFVAPLFAFAAMAADSSTPAAAPTPPAPEKAAPPAAQADPAVIEALLKALHFDEMMGKALDQQKQMIHQMIARASLPGTSKEDVAAFQQKAVDEVLAGLSPEDIHAIAMHNYSEIFTTDELRAITGFCNSSAGQAFLTKQPLAQQKIAAALRPRVMESMQKVQQLTRDFVAQQKAKAAADAAKAAAATAAKPSAAPTPAASGTPVLTLPKS